MASWVRKTNVRLKENYSERIKISKPSITLREPSTDLLDLLLHMRCKTWLWIKCNLSNRIGSKTAPVLVMCLLGLLLSWGGECSLGGLQCNHRKWWRTWPPPPQLGWQPGRWGTCPALCLAKRQEHKSPCLDICPLLFQTFLLFLSFSLIAWLLSKLNSYLFPPSQLFFFVFWSSSN